MQTLFELEMYCNVQRIYNYHVTDVETVIKRKVD